MWSSRVRPRFRLGIATRLVIAFIGVAVLILAANLLVEQGILIERTVRVVTPAPIAPAPAPSVPPPTHAQTQAPPPPPPVPAVPPALLERTLGELLAYNQAVQLRLTDDSVPAQTRFRQATARLDGAVAQVIEHASAGQANGIPNRIRADLRTYSAHAAQLVQIADTRRDADSSREALLEKLTTRVKQPLANAWTIFGRVVARQSLVQLGDDLESLRQHSEPLQAATAVTAAQVNSIDAAELRVKNTLTTHEAAFRSSQGPEWYQAMSTGMDQLIELRKSAVQRSSELSAGLQGFADQGNALREILFKASTVLVPGAAGPTQPLVAPASPLTTPIATPAATPPVPPKQVARPLETTSFSHAVINSKSRSLMAWASGAGAVLMVGMCVGIVVSVVRPVRRLLNATALIAAGDYSVRVAAGGITELDTLATAFNTMAGRLALAEETTQRHQQGLEDKIQERTRSLQQLSERDPLTGLPNRRHLFALLDAAIESAEHSGDLIGVLFLDVDNFKYINDGLGHAFGDSVLVEMSRRLAQITHQHGFAARLGGDEFTVVLDHAGTLADINAAGDALVRAFHAPLTVEGRELSVSISVGACAYPVHAKNASSLLKAADMALFRAKLLGRSQLSMYTSDLLDIATAKFNTEQGIRRALQRGEFELFFQPEINAETLEVELVEALIRWRSPTGEVLLPGAFLAVAEESGLAIEIGDWVLTTAIQAAAEWHHGSWPAARVAINVSPRQLAYGHFVDRVAELLAQCRVPAQCIEIELTESILQTGADTIESLKRLRDLGVAVALDDFGTGFSSLASLQLLPLSRVKLDRSLISGIDTSYRSAAIAEAIIGMCQKLGLVITAEGVERPEQFAYLTRQRAMCIQGFLLTNPMPREEILPSFAIIAERARELVFTARETFITAPVGSSNTHMPTFGRQPASETSGSFRRIAGAE